MHAPQFGCGIQDMDMLHENRHGLISVYSFKCKVCNFVGNIKTDRPSEKTLDINMAAVAATYEIGLGQSTMDTFLSVVGVPSMSTKTFAARSKALNDIYPELAEKSMCEAAELEAIIAREEGRVSEDGIPWIYVTADGAWCKRSYGTNYSSSGGIVSMNFKKLNI